MTFFGSERSRTRNGTQSEETRARLDDLMEKASLTRGEQLFVLKAMNDGGEI